MGAFDVWRMMLRRYFPVVRLHGMHLARPPVDNDPTLEQTGPRYTHPPNQIDRRPIRMSSSRNPYEILQVARSAEAEVIEAAYRRLARKYHPDVTQNPDASRRMQDINWAYEILSDLTRRASFDQHVQPAASGSSPGEAYTGPTHIDQRRSLDRIEPEMVRVPAGHFWMGSSDDDQEAFDVERPRSIVQVPAFWIARYPLTHEAYRLFLLANPDHEVPYGWERTYIPAGMATHPVARVSWYDALAYCEWLSKKSGRRYLLPSEAEWEKAARGIEANIYPWGDTWDPQRCNHELSHHHRTTPVGAYAPDDASPYGCNDMAGNVWEWTRSQYVDYPYDPNDGREDLRASEKVLRVLRGGSFTSDRRQVRCACRDRATPLYGNRGYGFRLVLHGEPFEDPKQTTTPG
jgi:formylglycine-generating enzyme required for sulfatase activity